MRRGRSFRSSPVSCSHAGAHVFDEHRDAIGVRAERENARADHEAIVHGGAREEDALTAVDLAEQRARVVV